ncbi:EthD domain-containing protein [Mesorhizobium sp. B2-3-5]|uniref:EthD domain-containing protein n=1 Tax=Mesorhizobium sp. B2-3-5 TaxID=2589958 RepID=UPI0011283E0D|nr:EthD domain-containing protein [Mesorhizobium sp. B2-3-5]TPM24609.1 EthD family reductase [Mesorhizobium sp. B2-3-5]
MGAVKIVAFFKRRIGMTRQEFIDYYETVHCKLAEKYLDRSGIVRYMRRYLNPIPDWLTDRTSDSGFDVVMELWFEDKASFDAAFGGTPDPVVAAVFREDEERIFDRSCVSYNMVEEYDTEYFRAL